MGIHPDHLRRYVIQPTLAYLADGGIPASRAAENLLLLTTAQETECGHYLHQNGGPALGIFQVEPLTHNDLWNNWLLHRPPLADRVRQLMGGLGLSADHMTTNLAYATAIARLIYYRSPVPLPDADDVAGLAACYKQAFNTALGAATVEQAAANYRRYVLGVK